MQKVEKKTRLHGYDVILFSLPIVFSNSSSLMFTIALSKFIKDKYNPILILGGGNQSVELLARYNYRGIDHIIYGDGEQTRDFLFVTETANAAIKVYNNSQTRGKIINIGSGKETSINTGSSTIISIY